MNRPVVTVVGSFAVGMTLCARRIPVFGETLVGSQFDMGPGGKGSNQAVAAARLGAESHFVGIIGSDPLGKMARALYEAEGVHTGHLVETREKATGVGFIIVNPEGRNGIILDMGANELIDRQFVRKAEAAIARSNVVLSVLEFSPGLPRKRTAALRPSIQQWRVDAIRRSCPEYFARRSEWCRSG